MLAPLPNNEPARLASLHSYNVLDTEADENFDRVVRLACAATSTPMGTVSLIDEHRQWFKARLGIADEETSRDLAFCAHAILEDEVMVVEDATRDVRFADNPLVLQEDGIRFYAGAPLRTATGFALGTLCVIDKIPRKIDRRTVDLLRDMAAIVVNELELRKIAGTDPLTGLYTRRMIDELGQSEVKRARRSGEALSVAILDVDRFKSINDNLGHGAGDAVLRALGPVCRNALRSQDQLGRYGGEEFVALLPGATLSQAHSVVERVRAAISDMQVPELTDGRQVTASIGISQFDSRDLNFATVVARADRALYDAKQSGRNRIAMADAA